MTRGAAALALLLAGCTVGPNYSPPTAQIPELYVGAGPVAGSTDAELANWWVRFGDPLLDRLIERAVAQNLDVQSAAARIREARAQEAVAGAAAQPRIAAQGSAARQRISENALPLPPGAGGGTGGGGVGTTFGLPGSEFDTSRAGFDASWEIDLFGRTRRAVEAAKAHSGAALWTGRDLQVSTAAEVANAYFRLRELQARAATAEAELARQHRFEQLVAARVRGGLATGQDLEQQRSERSATAAAIPVLEAQAKAQIHAIGVLTGDTPEGLLDELGRPAALPSAPAIPPGLPSDLLRRRPDIRSAERDLAAATANIGVATADLYPRFSLTATPALVSTALASLLEWGSRNYSLGASVGWPLFNGGRTRANIAVATARQEQALIGYRKTVLKALQDVEDALVRSAADRAQLFDLEQALSAQQRAEQIAGARYSGGLVTYSDVLLAQARRLKLEDQVTQTKGALARDGAALFKALGGGWPDLAEGGARQ
jgi:NodT family efflux transporter outer membrane factor (OMF) lipoprotein